MERCVCGQPVSLTLVNLVTGDLMMVCPLHVPEEMILDFVKGSDERRADQSDTSGARVEDREGAVA